MANVAASSHPPEVYPAAFGRNGSGFIPLPGAAAGEAVKDVINITTLASAAASFESTISQNGKINQTSGSNLSTSEFWFILIHS